MNLSRRIARIRTKLGLSQAAFAARTGLTRNMVIRYERGTVPRAVVPDRIAKVGGVNVDWLLHGGQDGAARRGGRNGGPAWEEAEELLRRAWREPEWRATVVSTLRALRPVGRA